MASGSPPPIPEGAGRVGTGLERPLGTVRPWAGRLAKLLGTDRSGAAVEGGVAAPVRNAQRVLIYEIAI